MIPAPPKAAPPTTHAGDPPTEWMATPDRAEVWVVERSESMIRSYARKVRNAHTINMTIEDIEQDFRLTLMQMVRKHRWRKGVVLSGALCNRVLWARQKVLIRTIRTPSRCRVEQHSFAITEGDADTLPVNPPDPTQLVESSLIDLDATYTQRAIVFAVRRKLTEEEFSLLYMRYIEGLPPRDIAIALGTEARPIGRRIAKARREAAVFLQSLGIETLSDLDKFILEDSDA